MTAMGIHIVDAMIHTCGDIESVQAQSIRQVVPCDIDDTTSVLIKFSSGATGYLGTLMATPRFWRLHVFGSKGWAELRGHENLDICGLDNVVREMRFPVQDIERAELEAFASAAAGGASEPFSLRDALHGISVHEAVVRSAMSGQSLATVSDGDQPIH